MKENVMGPSTNFCFSRENDIKILISAYWGSNSNTFLFLGEYCNTGQKLEDLEMRRKMLNDGRGARKGLFYQHLYG